MKLRIALWLMRTAILLGAASAGLAQVQQQTGTSGSVPPGQPQQNQGRTLSDRPAWDRRNSFGFTLGVLGFYDSNLFGGPEFKQAEEAVIFMPRLFANLGTRKSMLHADYQFGYRMFPDRRDLDAKNHEGGIEYSYEASRRTRFSISDRGRFGPNDFLLFTGQPLIVPNQGEPGLNAQVFFDQQPMWYNALGGTASHQWSRSNSFETSAYYNTFHYDAHPGENTSSVLVLATDDHRLNRRWSLSGAGSYELIDSVSGLRDGRIVRFVGGLKFQLGRSWEIAGRAGGERVHFAVTDQNLTTYEAALTRTSLINRFDLRYSRRSQYQLGLAGLNMSDTAEMVWDQRLGARMALQLISRYWRTSGLAFYGRLETISAGAGIEYAAHPSIVLSLSGNYFYQRALHPAVGLPDLTIDRYIVFAGITYLYPSMKRELRAGRGVNPIR